MENGSVGIVARLKRSTLFRDSFWAVCGNGLCHTDGCKQAYAEAEGWKDFEHIEDMDPAAVLDFSMKEMGMDFASMTSVDAGKSLYNAA